MAKIKTINLNGVSYDIDAHQADSATSLSLSQLIDGVIFDGTSGVKHYVVSTDARQNKALTRNGFQVVDGARLIVRFDISSAGADSPYSTYTLNINNTGEKPISYTNLSADQQLALKTTLNDGSGANVIEFVYDGNLQSWVVLSAGGGAHSYGLSVTGHTVSLVEDGDVTSVTIPDENTWQLNTSAQEGYVASGAGQANKVWKTDADGNPAWRDDTDTTYDIAEAATAGLVKLGSNTVQSIAADMPTAVAGHTYPIQLNSDDQMVVNIPWTDNNTWQANNKAQEGYVAAGGNNINKVWKTDNEGNPDWREDDNTTYSTATTEIEGLVKLGSDTKQTQAANLVSSESGKTYAVQLNNDNQMVVNVPWVDNNTWQVNTASQEGYVANPNGVKDAIWKTNSTTGAPEWTPLGDVLAVADAMIFKGTLGIDGIVSAVPTSGYTVGDTYRVISADTYAGQACEVGDLLIAVNDGPSSGSSVINTDWTVAQTNIDGALYKGNVYENGQMLLAQGTAGAVSTVAVNPYVQFGIDATTSLPTIRTFVGGINGDAIVGPQATTSNFGFTKLSDAINSQDSTVAASSKAIYHATANINNGRQSSDVSIFAPITSGDGGTNNNGNLILASAGNNLAPVWKKIQIENHTYIKPTGELTGSFTITPTTATIPAWTFNVIDEVLTIGSSENNSTPTSTSVVTGINYTNTLGVATTTDTLEHNISVVSPV